MRLTQLHYFDSAVRLGSLRAAAEHLDVSQPTLSEQLRALEEELGIVLLVRGRRGVSPTPAGEAILGSVRGLLASETAIRQEAGAIAGLAQGVTRVGSIAIAARSFLPIVMSRLASAHPGLQFQLFESGSNDIRRDVLAGELDLGILACTDEELEDENPNLHVVPLLRTRVLACVPQGHPLSSYERITMDQLTSYPLVLFPKSFVLRRCIEEHLGSARLPMVVQAGSVDTLHAMVAAGLGVGLVAELGSSVLAPGSSVAGRHFEGPPSHVSVCLIYRSSAQPSSSATALIRLARTAAAEWRAGQA